ncbi:MAG: carboxymuconolactone decarboxylase family protein [Eubacteriaceae bacterium]|nr:carboxymuconolactone decarboxylase family protein [Eubacteriaceae bacterium]
MDNQKPASDWLYMIEDTGELGEDLREFYQKTESKSALDKKTHQLVYIAYLAASGITKGVAKHTKEAKSHGATREEIQSVFTCGWAVRAACLSECYRIAMQAYDE